MERAKLTLKGIRISSGTLQMFYKNLTLRISQKSWKKPYAGVLFNNVASCWVWPFKGHISASKNQKKFLGYQFLYFLYSFQNLSVAKKHIRKSELIKNRPFLRLQIWIFVSTTLNFLVILFHYNSLSPIFF